MSAESLLDTVPDHEQRLEPDVFYGQTLTERFQFSNQVLGSGSFGHAFVCLDYGNPDSPSTVIAKVETVPTVSCFDKHETQLEHEYKMYKHLSNYPKLRKYLPTIHLFLDHYVTPALQIPVLVMGRAGKDLLTILIDQNTPYYELRTLGQLGVQVVHALKYIHEMFVVHRDIKPQNIMLIVDGPEFQIKLIDFGLSMPIPTENDPHRNRYRSSTCTLAFASWRQHFRHVCSARTDMESFLYSWAFLANTLMPWMTDSVREEMEKLDKPERRELIGHLKRQIDPEEICYVFDEAGPDPYGNRFSDLYKGITQLTFAERPKYTQLIRYFRWLSTPV